MLPVLAAQARLTASAGRHSPAIGRGLVLVSKQAPSPHRRAAARNFFTVVQQGHQGWRLTLGRDPVRLEPGFHIVVPVLHSVTDVDMRESSISIAKLPGYTSDNVPVTCSGSLFYRIVDGYKACFEVSDVQENIRNTGTSAMRSVLGQFTYDQVIGDRNGLNRQLNAVIGNSILNWGVECTRFEIQSFQPANREVERQLELQMEAERNRRKQILDTQAAINVAEGHKQRVILESEAHLQAKSNEADATFKTVLREAEARREEALLESSAIASQIETIARSLTPSNTAPTDGHRRTALETLLELKRLEQLQAIAHGQGNSTYFFGDRSALGVGGTDAYGVDYNEKLKMGIAPRTTPQPGLAAVVTDSPPPTSLFP